MGFARNRSGVTARGAAFAAALASLAVAASPAAALEKLRANERQAVQVRVLQSDMMVAALACDLKQQYGDAVRRFQPEFVTNAGHLRGYFNRAYGKRGEAELDRFVT